MCCLSEHVHMGGGGVWGDGAGSAENITSVPVSNDDLFFCVFDSFQNVFLWKTGQNTNQSNDKNKRYFFHELCLMLYIVFPIILKWKSDSKRTELTDVFFQGACLLVIYCHTVRMWRPDPYTFGFREVSSITKRINRFAAGFPTF